VILVLYLGDEEPQKCPTSLRYFGIMDRKSKDNCCIDTLEWEMLLEIAIGRARWRKLVKTDGVCKALNQWYIAENTKSNKRH